MGEVAELGSGSVVVHPSFGRGTVSRVEGGAYVVNFADGETRRIEIGYADWHVERRFTPTREDALPADGTDLSALRALLEDFGLVNPVAELGKRWTGGKVILVPGKEGTQPKEIPLEAFFKKIVGVRERLRVLEQRINANASLSAEEKLELQGYITRSYGSLTTFNVLFADKDAYFVGTGREE